MKRIVKERGDLVKMELAPDVFAVAWWHEPLPARETRIPTPFAWIVSLTNPSSTK